MSSSERRLSFPALRQRNYQKLGGHNDSGENMPEMKKGLKKLLGKENSTSINS